MNATLAGMLDLKSDFEWQRRLAQCVVAIVVAGIVVAGIVVAAIVVVVVVVVAVAVRCDNDMEMKTRRAENEVDLNSDSWQSTHPATAHPLSRVPRCDM